MGCHGTQTREIKLRGLKGGSSSLKKKVIVYQTPVQNPAITVARNCHLHVRFAQKSAHGLENKAEDIVLSPPYSALHSYPGHQRAVAMHFILS